MFFSKLLTNEIHICNFFPTMDDVGRKSDHICQFKENSFPKDFGTAIFNPHNKNLNPNPTKCLGDHHHNILPCIITELPHSIFNDHIITL